MGDWQVQRFCSWVLVTSCPAKVIINMGWPIGLKYAFALKLVFDPAVRLPVYAQLCVSVIFEWNYVLVWYLSESCVSVIFEWIVCYCDVEWKFPVISLWSNTPPVYLQMKFHQLKVTYIPDWNRKSFCGEYWPLLVHVSLSVMSNTVVCFLVEYAKVTLGLRKALHHENNNFTFVVFFPSPLLLHLLLSSVLLFFLCCIVSLSVPFFNLPPSLCLWWQTSLISCMRRPCQSWRRTWRAVRMMMMSPQSCDSLTSCQRSSPTSETPQPWPHSPNLLTRGRVKFETLVTELTFNCSGLFQRSSDIFRNVNDWRKYQLCFRKLIMYLYALVK